MLFYFAFFGFIFSLSVTRLQNEITNGHYKNAKFMCADVTSPDLDFPAESVDLIFSNWLLMYLSDKEVSFFLLDHFEDFNLSLI